ncbi:hypothetical protein [Ruminiclostridium josui]|uniref:hypothetical protein n=1 Tax=Ruminiclostridium josui TaxID=1499 RepID=UPI0004652763|nr:hypothetical protein [Ruminiclostridium josui]
MDDIFKIVKGKFKPTESTDTKKFWQNYLIGKTLTLCSSVMEGCWNLVGIDGEEKCKDFLKWVWDHEKEHDYESFEDMQEEMDCGNDGFGFEPDEIEVIEFLLGYDLDKKETVKP